MDKGGEIAANLDRLYGYILNRLTKVDIRNDAGAAREVIALLEPLRELWRELAKQGDQPSKDAARVAAELARRTPAPPPAASAPAPGASQGPAPYPATGHAPKQPEPAETGHDLGLTSVSPLRLSTPSLSLLEPPAPWPGVLYFRDGRCPGGAGGSGPAARPSPRPGGRAGSGTNCPPPLGKFCPTAAFCPGRGLQQRENILMNQSVKINPLWPKLAPHAPGSTLYVCPKRRDHYFSPGSDGRHRKAGVAHRLAVRDARLRRPPRSWRDQAGRKRAPRRARPGGGRARCPRRDAAHRRRRPARRRNSSPSAWRARSPTRRAPGPPRPRPIRPPPPTRNARSPTPPPPNPAAPPPTPIRKARTPRPPSRGRAVRAIRRHPGFARRGRRGGRAGCGREPRARHAGAGCRRSGGRRFTGWRRAGRRQRHCRASAARPRRRSHPVPSRGPPVRRHCSRQACSRKTMPRSPRA